MAFPKDASTGADATDQAPSDEVGTDQSPPPGTAGASDTATAAPDDFGLWQVEVTKSPIDDSPKVTAYLKADGQEGFTVTPKALYMRCADNTTNVVISTDTFNIGADTVQVITRVDDGKQATSRWEMATDGRSVGLWNGSTAIPFLRSIANAKKLAIRVQMRTQSDLVFADVTGIHNAVAKVAEACKWPAQK